MRKNTLLFTFILGFLVANAQIELRIDSAGGSVNGTTITVDDVETSTDVEQKLWVTQTSGAEMDIRAKSYVLSMTTGSYTICWYVCYAPQPATTLFFDPTDVVTVQNEAIISNFSGHYYPETDQVGVPATIRYVLYDNNNPSDSVFVDIVFNTIPTSIENISAKDVKLNAYPNPAASMVTIAYDIDNVADNNLLNLYDVLGQKIISKKLIGSKGSVQLDLETVQPGVYFYAIKVEGKTIRTERLIVR